MTRIIVTGSRVWTDKTTVWRVLAEQFRARGAFTLVHGACPTGADRYAAEWAVLHTAHGIVEEAHPAAWARIGRGAGLARNGEMIAAGADLVLAFIRPGAASPGTRHCVRLARAARIPVVTYPLPSPSGTGEGE